MELAFNVPFITIPVKKSIDMAQGAIANVNIGAVVLAGAIAFGFAVLIPGIVILMSKKSFNPIGSYLGYRSKRKPDVHIYYTKAQYTKHKKSISKTRLLDHVCFLFLLLLSLLSPFLAFPFTFLPLLALFTLLALLTLLSFRLRLKISDQVLSVTVHHVPLSLETFWMNDPSGWCELYFQLAVG
jgi:hypothetical protein